VPSGSCDTASLSVGIQWELERHEECGVKHRVDREFGQVAVPYTEPAAAVREVLAWDDRCVVLLDMVDGIRGVPRVLNLTQSVLNAYPSHRYRTASGTHNRLLRNALKPAPFALPCMSQCAALGLVGLSILVCTGIGQSHSSRARIAAQSYVRARSAMRFQPRCLDRLRSREVVSGISMPKAEEGLEHMLVFAMPLISDSRVQRVVVQTKRARTLSSKSGSDTRLCRLRARLQLTTRDERDFSLDLILLLVSLWLLPPAGLEPI